MNFEINPQLDLDKIALDYSTDQRVRVNDFLPQNQAVALSQCLAELPLYKHAFVLNGAYGEASDEDLYRLVVEDRRQLLTDIMRQAADGVGFWYERYGVTPEASGILKNLSDWLNSDALLGVIAKITGVPEFKSAVAQATRFKRGDFLTRHEDSVTQEKRKVAFVINLPPRWHPDWGGLLQFYEKDGAPRNAWAPDFNSLSLFDVSHVHSVTCISPFAPEARLAVSGWFRLA